jgi:hypothetical protein
MGWFNDTFSKYLGKATNAVGKIKRFGSSVGKVVTDTIRKITPEANTMQLSPEGQIMAEMSVEAYNLSNRKETIGPYNLDKSFSNNICAVYIDKNNKKIILAFRGTSQLKDIATDIDILKGQEAQQQFQEAMSLYNAITDTYKDYTVEATGHSKGGSLALFLNKRFGIKVEVFNPGVGGGVFENNPNKNKAILNIIKGDPISNLAIIGSIGVVRLFNPILEDNPHSMKNFVY